MELDFYKIHLCGNDFIIFNYLNKENLPEGEIRIDIARRVARRTEGIGANGILFLAPDVDAVARVYQYNYSGEELISSDAHLCVSRFMFDYGVTGNRKIAFASGNSVITTESIDSLSFRLSLGVPTVGREENLHINDKQYSFTPVTYDLPGASFFYFGKDHEEKRRIAEKLNSGLKEKHGIRTVFTSILNNDEIRIEPMFKRSVKDNTLAAGFAGVSAVSNGYCDSEILVNCRKKDLFFQWQDIKSNVFITAKPEYVFKGTYYYDESDF